MSIVCGTPFVNTTPSKEAVFRAELSKLPLPERARRIEGKLHETQASLGARDEKLLSLRPDFDRLTLEFLQQIPKPRRQCHPLIRDIGTTLLIVGVILVVVYGLAFTGNTGMAACIAVLGVIVTLFCFGNLLIQPSARVTRSQKQQPEPFWITGGAIALSNLGITPPAGAKWWWQGRIALVFVHGIGVQFSLDARTGQVIWSSPMLDSNSALEAPKAAEILSRLFATTPAYRQLVHSFDALAGLDHELAFLQNLKVEADRETAEEKRKAQPQTPRTHAPESRQTPSAQADHHNIKVPHSEAQIERLTWNDLIIEDTLREKLQTYCEILRQAEAFKDRGVSIPKGLLFYGPSGTGKTQTARVLAAQSGFAFVGCTTADIKQGWLGHSGQKVKEIFANARATAPTILFIDELEAITNDLSCSPDTIVAELTAQLLQEIDGIHSHPEAVFLIGATNQPERINRALFNRFTEKVEYPLPSFSQRIKLLDLLIGRRSLASSGIRRAALLETLALQYDGASGRDLRTMVERATIRAISRAREQGHSLDFALTAEDFTTADGTTHYEGTSPATTTTTERIPHLQEGTRIREASFQLDPQVRNDSVVALMALGFKKREAQSRVDAVTTGSSAEEIIKAALRGHS